MNGVPFLGCLAAGLLLAGCATQRATGIPIVNASDARVVLEEAAPAGVDGERWEDQIGGPWQVVAAGSSPFDAVLEPDEARAGPETVRSDPVPTVVAPVARRRVPSRPALVVPKRRAATEARPKGKKTGKTTEQLAREHFLDYPTRVRATKITFYCPPAYAAEVRLSGASVRRFGTHNRRAQGGARLLLRELTLEAERISFKVRDDGEPDLQILARGAAGVVSEVRGNVVREEGLRSLVLTNDRMVPLR